MRSLKILIVMPAYNAAKTLKKTLNGIPRNLRRNILVVDDASQDGTTTLSKKLGLRTITHKKNRGYGGNLKTCLAAAGKEGADITIELHPDNQYDARQIPALIQKVLDDSCDLVLGSRFSTANPHGPGHYGMHWYRILANRVLTFIDRLILGRHLSEFHSGFRAYSSRFLHTIPYAHGKDNYTFSFEVITQAVYFGLNIGEIPVTARYTKESRSASIKNSALYALQTFQVLIKFLLQKYGLWSFPLFEKRT